MGVPKFFRYISERYPCLSEVAREHSIPEFDNLYLDMNGIVHNCSHPDDGNIHFHLEQEQIFQEIFNYLDKLYYLIKPQKLFFLSVDGVAPRAKMNQQRSRRFRSAREAEMVEAKAMQRGEKREHERFDSNCITPGTEFMDALQIALRLFLRHKISTDPLWQKCKIILSGQETPGEGEHKIMDYIRYLKSLPNFDPNTRHCLYGLDADLIILGLCTHELHFVVLREEVKFGRNVKRASVEETRFFLLHLGLLREYLELEFHQLKQFKKDYDIADLIDDWVLMGFLVGNDFVPHLPCLHISSNALPLLYKTYINVYEELGGNINEHGKLNLKRLQIFLKALSAVELELFEEHFDDLKYMQSKTEAFDVDVSEIQEGNFDPDLAALIDDSMQLYGNDDDDDSNSVESGVSEKTAALKHEFNNYKRNYYRNKFKREMSSDLLNELSEHYVTALQWICHYYYRGVQSWNWYYPFHYAPFISDLKNIEGMEIEFDLGTPFLPFQQLLAVLPGASSKLLPTVYHPLMLSPESPLAEFYPTEFESDLNGKKHEWEAVVLIPFIEEERLLNEMHKCENQLTLAEKARNKHGPMYLYEYTAESQGSLPGVGTFKALNRTFCTEKTKWSEEIALNVEKTVCVELPNSARHVFFPGFPTTKHLLFDFEFRNDRVKVFEQASRNPNLVLMPRKRDLEDTLTAVAQEYFQQVVYIGWPHLIKALVVKVATKEQFVDSDGIHANDTRQFYNDCKSLREHFVTRMGIHFDNYNVLVYIRTFAGSTIEFAPKGKLVSSDAWSSTITGYPAQGVVSNISVQENMHLQFKNVEELFPVGSTTFFIGKPYYGSEGTVLDPGMVNYCGRVQIMLRVLSEPDLTEARELQEQCDLNYKISYEVSNMLRLSNRCLGRLVGNVLVVLGPRRERMENVAKHNIGLQLKYVRQNEERIGYCVRQNDQWFFSSQAIELIQDYTERFPEIINFLSSSNERSDCVFEQDIYPDNMGQHRVEDVANWVRQQPHMKVERVACGSKTVCKEAVESILTAIEGLKSMPCKQVKLQVKPFLLVKPDVTLPDVYKSRRAPRLFDRVVVVRTIYMVPIGSRGTIIGIYLTSDPNPVRLECVRAVDTVYEILFDKVVPNCNDVHGIADERVYKVPDSALVVIYINENNSSSSGQQGNVKESQPQRQTAGAYNKKKSAENKEKPITAIKSRNANQATPPAVSHENWRVNRQTSQPTQSAQPSENADWRSGFKGKQSKHPTVQMEDLQIQQRAQSRQQQPAQDNGHARPARQSQSGLVAAQRQDESNNYVNAVEFISGLVKPPDSQQATEALKSLLGLKPQETAHNQLGPRPSDIMPKFPQPPLCWQHEAKQQQQREQNPHPTNPPEWVGPPQQVPTSAPRGVWQEPRFFTNKNYNNQVYQQQPSVSNYNYRQQFMPNVNNSSNSSSGSSTMATNSSSNGAARMGSSVRDFVPIQAYRPKKSKRPQQQQQPSPPPIASTSWRTPQGSVKDSSNMIMNNHLEMQNLDSVRLMQALKIEPQPAKELPDDAGAGGAPPPSSPPISPKVKPQPYKPRVPRIGAKFDLDYIIN